MNTPPPPVNIKNLKKFLRIRCPQLKPQIALCGDIDDVLELISEKSSLTNITILEAVVNKFNISQAKVIIQKYKDSIAKFRTTVSLRLSLNEYFAPFPSLQCETATFLVDRLVDDVTLKDIEELVYCILGELAVIVKVEKINSFAVICSFHFSLSQSLITSALSNIELLQAKGVYHLTIGYCTVYNNELQVS